MAQLSEVGVKVGPSATTWNSSFEKDHPIVSMVVGAYAPIRIAPKVLLQPELEIALMGTAREMDSERSTEVRMCYARLPLTLRFRMNGVFQLAAGVQAGYLLAAQQVDSGTMTNVKDAFKPIDVALLGGASITVGESTDLALRYIYGMSTLLKDDDIVYPTNRALQLTVGFRIARMNSRTHFRRRK